LINNNGIDRGFHGKISYKSILINRYNGDIMINNDNYDILDFYLSVINRKHGDIMLNKC
jgi:hypothetical protein